MFRAILVLYSISIVCNCSAYVLVCNVIWIKEKKSFFNSSVYQNNIKSETKILTQYQRTRSNCCLAVCPASRHDVIVTEFWLWSDISIDVSMTSFWCVPAELWTSHHIVKLLGYTCSICSRCMSTPLFFCHYFTRETTLVTSCLLPWMKKPSQKGIYSYRKEFASWEVNSFLEKFNSDRTPKIYN